MACAKEAEVVDAPDANATGLAEADDVAGTANDDVAADNVEANETLASGAAKDDKDELYFAGPAVLLTAEASGP